MPTTTATVDPGPGRRLAGGLQATAIPAAAIAVSLLLFALFVRMFGANPVQVFHQMIRGSFGTWFSFQNTLQRAAPLMLTALCTALPARLGMVIIGGEGALVIGGLAAAVVAMGLPTAAPLSVQVAMLASGFAAGGLWIGLSAALRAYRGVNETISSLLLNYIAIALLNYAVEGPLRDPASLNKPSTPALADAVMLGNLPGLDVHVGLAFGLVLCLIAYLLMHRTVFGFSARMVGGNVRAAQLSGLPVARLMVITALVAGGAAGIAGVVEVAAVQGSANASLVAGYGYSGILVAFIARHNPLAVIPVALLLGGIGASGGLLQRMFHLPDAAVNVLEGILFITILFSETFQGRPVVFRRRTRPAIAEPLSEAGRETMVSV